MSSPAWAEGLTALGYGLRGDGLREPLGTGGRSQVHRLAHDRGPLVVRRFSHGGLLRRWTGEVFARPDRALDEAELLLEFAALGLPVVEPVAVRALAGTRGYQLELVTREVVGSRDLREFLLGDATSGPGLGSLAWGAGNLTRRAHDLGLDHVDLQPANFLACPPLEGLSPRLLLLDLDRCRRIDGGAPPEVRVQNLARLGRWLERRGVPGEVQQRLTAAFLLGYEPRRDARRVLRAAVHSRVERRRPLQRLGARLEAILGLSRL